VLQADFVISSMRWALGLHEFAVSVGFDRNRRGGSLQKMRNRAINDDDPTRDKFVDTTGWMNFMDDAEGAMEMKLERFYAFSRALRTWSTRFPGLAFLNSHLLDTFFLFCLPFECRESIELEEAAKLDEHRNPPGGRSKWSERYFSQPSFRLPVLDSDVTSMYYQILPEFCDRSDILDPYVKLNRLLLSSYTITFF
jgi:hypothetical protein